MFRRRPKRPVLPDGPRVTIDPYLGSAAARECREHVLAGRFDHARDAYWNAGLSDREQVVWAFGDHNVAEAVGAWAIGRPTDPIAMSALGASTVTQAARLFPTAKDQRSEENLRRAVPTLIEAESRLHRAIELDRSSTAPWQWLLRSGRFLSISVHELRLRYEQATRRGGPTLATAVQMLIGESAWRGCGTHEAMHRFADETARTARPGSPLHVLPVMAEILRATEPDADSQHHFALAAAAVPAAASHSVDDPSFEDTTPDAAIARNVLCCAAARGSLEDEADRQRAAIGGRIHGLPWRYLGDPEVVYLRKWPPLRS